MAELQGIEYLRKKLEQHRRRVLIRYKQYDMKYFDKQRGITIPPHLRQMYKAVLGWCGKAVDSLADRLVFREFADDNFNLMEIYQMNNPDVLFDSAILSALISSCSFIYILPGDDMPRMQVIDGANATGVIDDITGLLYEGYAILDRDNKGTPTLEAYFEPKRTTYYENGKINESMTTDHKVGYPLLVPIIHRPDALRPFGRSRITRSAMYHQAAAKRTLERADITAEFYSWPQKYVVGTSRELELDTWKATVSSMLEISKDSDGDSPSLGQFSQPSMTPFIDQLRMSAALFAGETGLTLDDLGFVTDNPSSADAIKASHETLRTMARKAQRCFGSGFLNAGFLAACLRDDFQYKRSQLYKTKPKWEPVFEADAATLSLIGDGAIKVNQAIPGYFNSDTLRDLTGIEGAANG